MTTVKKLYLVSDPYWTLEQWQNYIAMQIQLYGKDSKIYLDAGYNNVEVQLHVQAPEARKIRA